MLNKKLHTLNIKLEEVKKLVHYESESKFKDEKGMKDGAWAHTDFIEDIESFMNTIEQFQLDNKGGK